MGTPQRRYDLGDWLGRDAFGLGYRRAWRRLPIRKHRWWSYAVAVVEVPIAVLVVWAVHRWLHDWVVTVVVLGLTVVLVGLVVGGAVLVRDLRRTQRPPGR